MSAELVKARRLVVELASLGLGDFDASTVRRWIQEEPPCPIADRGRKGQSHRYRVADVVAWLRDREIRRNGLAAAEPETPRRPPAGAIPSVSGSLAQMQESESEAVQRLLEILEGRDPRNWKAAEEALTTRLKRLELQGDLVRSDELRRCLQAQQAVFRSTLQMLRSQIKTAVRSIDTEGKAAAVVDREVDLSLERLADDVADQIEKAAA